MADPNLPPSATPDWEGISQLPQFKALLRDKIAFIIPCCVFFVSYYFLLPILAGWYPELMKKRILGPLSAAYVFALSQFFMAWGLAWLYVRRARKWDAAAAQIIE
jgi:uncharacterized membrane protein (DUF485 family)